MKSPQVYGHPLLQHCSILHGTRSLDRLYEGCLFACSVCTYERLEAQLPRWGGHARTEYPVVAFTGRLLTTPFHLTFVMLRRTSWPRHLQCCWYRCRRGASGSTFQQAGHGQGHRPLHVRSHIESEHLHFIAGAAATADYECITGKVLVQTHQLSGGSDNVTGPRQVTSFR